MGELFRASLFTAKEDARKFVIFEPTVLKKDKRTIRVSKQQIPKAQRGLGGFTLELSEASKKFNRRFF